MTEKSLLPVPLDGASVRVAVRTCQGCQNGRRDIEDSDPDNFGIGGCCDGFGVQLEVQPGCELLVFQMALVHAWSWAYGNKGQPGTVSSAFFEDVEDQLAPYLKRYAPHRSGASASPAYAGSAEHRQDQEIVKGSTLYEMDPDFA